MVQETKAREPEAISGRQGSGAARHLLLALIALGLIVAGLYAVRTLTLFVSPMLFLGAVFFEATCIVVFFYCVIRALSKPSAVLRSLGASAWTGLESNEYIVRLMTSDKRWVRWLRNRFRPDEPRGLWLTATVVVAAIPLMNFIGLAVTITGPGPLTQMDHSIANLMPKVRTAGETAFFATATMLANAQTLILVTAVAAVLLWFTHRRVLAVAVIVSAIAQEALYFGVKEIIGRERPDASLALLYDASPSFPSGHVMRATVAYGVIAYLLFRACRTGAAKAVTAGFFLLTVLVVALSRVYLGVHYPTDVWGSMLLGGSLLIVIIGTLEIIARYPVFKDRTRPVEPGRLIVMAPAVGILFSAAAAPLLIHPEAHTVQQHTHPLASLDVSSLSHLPLYSETLTGDRMEPANFIYVGSEDELVRAFESRGWDRAEPSNLANTLRAFAVGFQGGQYATAPVTPSFMDSQPEAIAFQKATATNSLRQRHHTRIWRTEYTAPDGRPIWEATASFDDGIEFAGTAKVPTHHIDPNIDAERSYIAGSLGYADNLINLTVPQMGHNASGDEFFTDGRAELISLR